MLDQSILEVFGEKSRDGDKVKGLLLKALMRNNYEEGGEVEDRIDLGNLISTAESSSTGTWQESNITPPTGQLPSERDAMQDLHTVLGLGGMMPAIGNVADLVDAGIYGLEGKGGEAALSLAAAVPFIGQGATAGRIAKALKKGKNLFKKSNVADVSKLGKKTGDTLPSGKTFKIDSGGEIRDVTTVAVRNADGSISHQPFYKSSGTSGPHGASRKDRWMPYIGQGGGGLFHKGRINLKGKQVSHMADTEKEYTKAQEFAGRFGGDPYNIHSGTKRMVGISDKLKKLEKGFKQTGEGTLQGEIGKWIGKKNLGDLFF